MFPLYLSQHTLLHGDFFPFFLRGKGDYFRLGHGTDAHVRKPQLAESLKTRKIVDVTVGALHCLAVTDTGQVGTATYCQSYFQYNTTQIINT